ncbi:uncharacterized protein LOC116306082 isoform X2 [Actinia tenebrosa]|uniref:Uncharacterized protein LOC116306082 isoform X2 n=1 Tax=Actinia tenebrosa TaxID=6105 RepID=A0A6P8IX75_ACTTE|nr:uncharacterized protein LOC116306082 isoform X2 [Actinia tenebrosa]
MCLISNLQNYRRNTTDRQLFKFQKMITVRVKLEFVASGHYPPVPPELTLTVPEGTNLHQILERAAEQDTGYNFTLLTYPHGHMITSICGVHNNPDTNRCWMVYSNPPDALIPSGIDEYQPHDASLITFKFLKIITVRVSLDFTKSGYYSSSPPELTLRVLEGTNLNEILQQAAKKDPAYTNTLEYCPSVAGHTITSICGVHINPAANKYWMIFSTPPGAQILTGIDEYEPEDGSLITFKFQ